MKNLIIFVVAVFFFIGCGANNNKAVDPNLVSQKKLINLLDVEEEVEDGDDELYFLDSKGKTYYGKSVKDQGLVHYSVMMMLENMFIKAKGNLPKISRKKQLNIALNIEANKDLKEKLLRSSQSFVIEHKAYALSNTDKSSLDVLKKTMMSEQDAIYEGENDIEGRKRSNIILVISGKKKDEKIELTAKILAKNGSILANTFKSVDLSPKKDKKWVTVTVPRAGMKPTSFEIMKDSVSIQEFSASNDEGPAVNISFLAANHYCMKEHQGMLVSIYAMDYARRGHLLNTATAPANSEIIAPFDEEDDEDFYSDGDKLVGDDSQMVLFKWNNEKYFVISNLYKSYETTFRCMRAK